jgi:hypothetical protein
MTIEDWSDVPAIPVFPNWSSPYTERYEFRTTVFESDTGDEQRRSLRQRPRRSLQYNASFDRETMRDLTAKLTLRRDTKVRVPDVTQSVEASYVDAFSVAVEAPAWALAGEAVFLREGQRAEMGVIASVGGGLVSFESELIYEYTTPRMSPARHCRFPSAQKVSFLTSEVGTASLLLEIDPGTELEDYQAATPVRFRGQDTMFVRPNWRDGTAVTFGIPGDRVDYGVGQIAVDYRQVLNTKVMEFSYLARDRSEVRKHLDLFYRCKGRRGVFYIPTWTSDFEVIGPVDYGTNEITVRGVYRQELDPFDFSHRNIALIWGDTVVPCGIYSATTVGEGLKLKLDRNLSALPIPPRFFVSWLVMARFASDELAIDWRTDTIAEISYNVAVLRDSFREFAIGSHRVVFLGDYVLLGD